MSKNSVTGKAAPFFRLCRTVGCVIKAVTAFLLCAVLFLLLYLGTLGFPPWLVRRIADEIGSDDVAVTARVVRLVPPREVVLRDVRLLPRRSLAPPILQVRRVGLRLRLHELVRGRLRFKEVVIEDGVLRPPMKTQDSAGSPSPVTTPIRQHWRIKNCELHGVMVEKLDADIEWSGMFLNVTNARGVVAHNGRYGDFSGEFKANRENGGFAGRVATRCDPYLLMPLMQARGLTFLEELTRRFEFDAAGPDVELRIESDAGGGGALRIAGDFRAGELSYLGVPVLKTEGGLDMTFLNDSSVVRVSPLRIVRDEGVAEGGFTIISARSNDVPTRGEVEFDADSSLHPEALLRMIGLIKPDEKLPFRFEAPFKLIGSGKADTLCMAGTKFAGTVHCGALGDSKTMIRDCDFNMEMEGVTNRCSNIAGTLFGGSLTGAVEVVVSTNSAAGMLYRASLALRGGDFERCVKEWHGVDDAEYRGVLSGTLHIEGVTEDPDWLRLTGDGSAKVRKGRVFLLPVFGGLSRYLVKILPGTNFLFGQSDASAAFVIKGGRISTEKLLIEGDVLSLRGRGAYGLDGSLDFGMQVRLMKDRVLLGKLLQFLTFPISKLFEFRLHGTLADPKWYPVNFSSDLLEKIHRKEEGSSRPFPEAKARSRTE